ncbi:MAG: hypothetical protein QXF11_02685 [Candidatus Hadarchaeales archaeon]
MEIFAANHSSYPKIGDAPDQQTHRIAYARWERGEISDEEFEKIQDLVVKDVIEEQKRAGIQIVTDGLIRWYDPVSHIARGIDGCEINGLLRFFDTNFYFRQPVLKNRPRRKQPVLLREFEYAKSVTDMPVKAVMIGPYTFTKLSINMSGLGFEDLVLEVGKILAEEAKDLSKAGAELIQVEEPAILKNVNEFEIFKSAFEIITKEAGEERIILTTYFGDVKPLYERLLEIRVGGLGFDLTYSPNLPDLIAKVGCEKDIWLGIVDGRNTKMEREEDILRIVRKIAANTESRRIFLMPSCGLGEYLPRKVAFKKLVLLSKVVERWKNEQEQA